MGKSALLYSLVFAATASFTSFAKAADYQGIRMFQTSDQFEQAVQADTVVIALPNNLTLHRTQGSAEAKRTIQHVIAQRDSHGQIERELVTSCELSKFARKQKVILPNTSGTANPWQVMGVRKHNGSKQTWTLGRRNSDRISLTCRSFERENGELIETTLTATAVNRALSSVNGSVLTSVQPAEMMLDSRPFNDVVSPPAPIHESNVAR